MGHIFISYSHHDKVYVHKLQAALQREGFEVWIDDRIDYGEEWPLIIQERLDNCDAFILVASEDSFKSKWVQKEVTRAQRMNKPFFPLLLGGHPWLVIESTQYVDVRDKSLPPAKFYQRLDRAIKGIKEPAPPLAPSTSPPDPKPQSPKPSPPAPKPQPSKPQSTNRILFVIGFIGIVGMLCTCAVIGSSMLNLSPSQPANTRASTRTTSISPTKTVIPTRTPVPLPTMISVSWPMTVNDTFDSNSNNWKLGDYDGELATWNNSIANGILLWNAKAKDSVIGRVNFQSDTEYSDLFLSVDGKQLSGPDTATYGLLFRFDDNSNYYNFRVSGNLFAFFLHNNDEWLSLIEWTESPAVVPNGKNNLAVLAIGDHFTFYVNEQYVAEYEDSQLSTGGVAVMIGLYNADEQAVFEFDNFVLRTP